MFLSIETKIMKNIKEIAKLIIKTGNEKETVKLFQEIFTPDEISVISKRWRILSMLSEGKTQREIAKKLNVSLCKITRGSKILKDKKSVVYRYFMKENNDEIKYNS